MRSGDDNAGLTRPSIRLGKHLRQLSRAGANCENLPRQSTQDRGQQFARLSQRGPRLHGAIATSRANLIAVIPVREHSYENGPACDFLTNGVHLPVVGRGVC
jgi:hypothetical protein